MGVTHHQLKSAARLGVPFSYGERDSMLYAICVGMGRDPMNEQELEFVYRTANLKTLPTQVCVVARTQVLHDCGLDRTRMVLGEQSIEIFRPLPSSASLIADTRIVETFDKGEGKGSVLYVETRARNAASGEEMFRLLSTVLARGDGGIGGPTGSGHPPHTMPTRAPDLSCESETRLEQALLYCLTGDRNPLHAEPHLAQKAGFNRPILHGMCTYGIACREIVARLCAYDHTRVAALAARFTSPLYPGERILTDLWIDGDTISFRCSVPDRNCVVLNNGRCVLRRP